MWGWSSIPCSCDQLMRGKQSSMSAPSASELEAVEQATVCRQLATAGNVSTVCQQVFRRPSSGLLQSNVMTCYEPHSATRSHSGTHALSWPALSSQHCLGHEPSLTRHVVLLVQAQVVCQQLEVIQHAPLRQRVAHRHLWCAAQHVQ